jgi:hypothetical protein
MGSVVLSGTEQVLARIHKCIEITVSQPLIRYNSSIRRAFFHDMLTSPHVCCSPRTSMKALANPL